MSELLSAAAAALGLPESLVQRSAEARAVTAGASPEDILAAWSSGETVAAPTTTPTQTEAPASDAPVAAAPPPTGEGSPVPETPIPAVDTSPALATPAPPATEPETAPVLVGGGDDPMRVLTAAIALFVISVLVGLVGPSLPTAAHGARSSNIAFTPQAEEGKTVYAKLGCAACHTQVVRPVVADVGLGTVTLNDTNQILGFRRFGPDLAEVGSRRSSDELRSVIPDGERHPRYDLSTQDLDALVAYLSQSGSQGTP